ncbi:MAG: tetratricopeptide repeat protein [Candidatus Omnitrophica bacterium]|nr:tetratricopeptide repeat protein [Candidatus Omnitrophota bacterium]
MKEIGRRKLKIRFKALAFLFASVFVLLSAVKLSSEGARETYQGVLGEQIKSTQQILKAKEVEYQQSKEENLRRDLVQRAIKKKAENLFKDGYKYYKGKKYEEAIAIFKEALAIYPQQRKSKIYLSKTQNILEKKIAHEKKRQDSIKRKKEKKEKARLLAESRQRKREEKLRLRIVKQAKIKQIKYHYLKGSQFLKNGQYKQAIEEFNKVLLLDPSHTQAKRLLAKAEAKAEGREGIEAELKDNFCLAIKYIEDNKYRKAEEELLYVSNRIEELEKIYRQKSTSLAMSKETEKKSDKVVSYIDKEEYERAKEDVSELLEKISILAQEEGERESKKIISEEVDEYFNSALDAIDKGAYTQAKFKLERILEIDPENEEAISLLERVKEVIIISGTSD